MKRVCILAAIVVGILSAIISGAVPVVRSLQRQKAEQTYLAQWKNQMESLDAHTVSRHLNLAKWYNWNLSAETPDFGFSCAYDQILSFQDGIMGLLVLPGGEIPIYHQGRKGMVPGAEHRADTPLPVGGRGNHVVLLLPEGMDAGSEAMVSCLGRTLFYRAAEENTVNRDTLSLISGDGTQAVVLTRCETIAIARDQRHSVDAEGIYSAVCVGIMTALLPVVIGIILAGIRKILSLYRNHRK